jgi:LysM repeat protein
VDRAWRRYAAPAAFLLAATIAVVLVRSGLESGGRPATTGTTTTVSVTRPRYYRVRAGDTLQLIAKRSHVSLATLRRLNPNVSPTTLRIGERIRIR